MNADAFRQLYDYHFTENRKLWDNYVAPLSQKLFAQDISYSIGSIRNQIVHLMSADDYWFSGLRGLEMPDWLDPAEFDDREALRAKWDEIEQNMRSYLANLQDNMLFQRPFKGGDEILILWQVLLHVINHGTDHRAQILRALYDLGVSTGPQDYIFYVFGDE